MSEALIDGIFADGDHRGLRAGGAVEEAVEEKAQGAAGDARIVEVVSLVPGFRAGQGRRGGKADEEGKEEGQQDAGDSETDHTVCIAGAERIAEEELADKGPEAGREHIDVEVVLKVQPADRHVQKGREKTGPDIEKVQAEEAVGDHEEIPRERVAVRGPRQKDHEQGHGEPAEADVEQAGRQAPQTEVVRDRRAGRHEDPHKVLRGCFAGSRIECAGSGSGEEPQGDSQGEPVDDPAVQAGSSLIAFFCFFSCPCSHGSLPPSLL